MTGPTSRSPYHGSSSRSRRSSTGISAPRSNGNPNSNNAMSSLLTNLPGIDTTGALNIPPAASSTTSRGSLDLNFDLGVHSNLHGTTGGVPPFHSHFDTDHSRLSFGSTVTNQQTGGTSSHFLSLNGSSSSSFDLSSPTALTGNNAAGSGRTTRRNRASLGSTFGTSGIYGGSKRVPTRNIRSSSGTDGGVLANAIPNANATIKHDLDLKRNSTVNEKLDGKEDSMDHDQQQSEEQDNFAHFPTSSISSGTNKSLRALIECTMYSPTQSISPSTAAFYASILYTKTSLPWDAFLYAQALCANNEKRRAVTILDRAGLLSFETLTLEEKMISFPKRHGSFDQVQNGIYDREYQNEAALYDEKKYLNCILESMLLACDCYGSFGEWEEVMNILDDACQYETIMVTGDIDVNDSDGIHGYEPPGWAITTEEERKILALARYLHGNELQASVSPVARLAFMRGRACDESANPIRASCFLKLALFIDVKCVDAWLYLCQRRLMTSEEELEMVTCLKFEDSEMEWLKDIFYARLSLSEHVLEEENKSAFMNAGAGLFRESIGSPISSSVLPHFQSTPQINIDTSAIHFQPTPGTPFNFIGANQAKGLSSKQKAIGKSSKNVEIKKQVEQSFQNLYQKHDLSHSPDILALAATRAFNSYNLALALHYCQILYERDPLCTSAASIQIATLAALGHKRPLFRLAHALVDADSKSGTAWYAVGCYYYACGKYDLSQQYFWRATRLDPRNAECWIAFGCAFAACDENDQANACFRSAQRLHSGSHYPMLYIGMEHLRTNNIPLAGHFLKSAMSMESSDPLCANELGVWAYRKKDWNEAITWFTLALRLYVEADISEKDSLAWHEDDLSVQQGSDVKNYRPRFEFGHRTSKEIVHSLTDRDCVEFCQEAFWEPTLFNLGQSYRKNRQFEDAIHCFEKCISICPENCMPFAALGFTRHLIGDLDGAIEAYHQALSRKSDDPFAQEMLDKALEESMNMCGLFDGDDELHNSCMKTRHSPLVPSKDSFVRHNMSTIDDAEESNITFGDSTSDIDMSMT